VSEPRLGRAVRHLEIDFFGPPGPLAGARLRQLRLALGRLRSPWDGLLAVGVLAGLYGLAIAGATLMVAEASSGVAAAAGLAVVAGSVGASSYLRAGATAG
jgi:hypothetical protein